MSAITDAPPGTVPEWAIRVAYDGEEWLVLGSNSMAAAAHACGLPFERRGYQVGLTSGWAPCPRCGTPVRSDLRGEYCDDLAEAHAAFERIELEWLEAKR